MGHGCCGIDENRMIILGGENDGYALSSGFVYDKRTKQSTRLPNDMPSARSGFCAVANERYMYIIGGLDADDNAVRYHVSAVVGADEDCMRWCAIR